MRALTAVVLLALTGASARASHPVHDGVVDRDGKVVYFVNDKDQIAAVEVATNKQLWARDRAANLVTLVGDKLVGWASGPKKRQFHIVVLGAKTGDVLKRTDGIDLEDIAGARFDLSTRTEADELILEWTLTETRQQGGIPRPPFVPKTGSGAAAVNLETGKVRELRPKKPEPAEVPEVIKKLPSVSTSNFYGSWTTPFTVGDVVASPELTGATRDKMAVRLTTYDRKSGKRLLEPVALMEGADLWLQQSADGRHVVVRASTGDRAGHVFDLLTGKKVGALPTKDKPEPAPTVAGGVALTFDVSDKRTMGSGVYLRASSLQVYDLATGKLLWARPRKPEAEAIPRPGRP